MNKLVNNDYTLKPLEKSALYEMRGRAVLVSHLDGTPMLYGMDRVAAVLDTVTIYGESKQGIVAIYGRGLTLGDSEYGITWVAYDYELPEESKQLEAALGDLHIYAGCKKCVHNKSKTALTKCEFGGCCGGGDGQHKDDLWQWCGPAGKGDALNE